MSVFIYLLLDVHNKFFRRATRTIHNLQNRKSIEMRERNFDLALQILCTVNIGPLGCTFRTYIV